MQTRLGMRAVTRGAAPATSRAVYPTPLRRTRSLYRATPRFIPGTFEPPFVATTVFVATYCAGLAVCGHTCRCLDWSCVSKSELVRFRCSVEQKQCWLAEADRRGVALSALAELALDVFCGVTVLSETVSGGVPGVGARKRSYEPDWRPTKVRKK